ncbi:MAG: response regulator [Burkholderiaceae bacterium]|jgi:DNA-binding NtrC family response regulator|nr:response regulator [Burkholderiaceae bacterium]
MATVLIVDDESGIRDLLSEILSEKGHVVLTAENAMQARDIRMAGTPDLVLLDIWMPDTDGITLLKEWGRNDLLTMPIIMMSGHASIDTAVEATRYGAIGFLEKPITIQKLLKAVESGLLRRNAKSVPAPQTPPIAADAPARPATPLPDSPSYATTGYQTVPPAPHSLLDFDLPLRAARDLFERVYFEYHMMMENGSMSRIAEKAGLERTHLYRKLKQLGIMPQKFSKK